MSLLESDHGVNDYHSPVDSKETGLGFGRLGCPSFPLFSSSSDRAAYPLQRTPLSGVLTGRLYWVVLFSESRQRKGLEPAGGDTG